MKSILLLLLSFSSFSCYPQKHYRQLYFHSYGLQAYWGEDDSCVTATKKQFGFDYKTKAGCVVRPFQAWRYDHHNDRVERILIRRHGTDWQKKYEDAMEACEDKQKRN